jgi:p-cumate 2,3-dioxygenase subunit beta
MTVAAPRVITRAEVEDFLYHEAALLDEWKLNEWQELLTDDAAYYVPRRRPSYHAVPRRR